MRLLEGVLVDFPPPEPLIFEPLPIFDRFREHLKRVDNGPKCRLFRKNQRLLFRRDFKLTVSHLY